MALTEEEKKMAKAYNIGYLLSSYEPRLMEKIIKASPKNEFVQAMRVGRDHHHIHANMPRKDQSSREFRNGFFNGRTLAQHEPQMIENLLTGKGLHKDYKKGLEAAHKEHEIMSIKEKMKQEPKTPKKELRNDRGFQKGFNIGYRLAESHGFALGHLERTGQQYNKYMDGIKAGREQYEHDINISLREKEPDAKIFPDDPLKSHYENALANRKYMELNDVAEAQSKVLIRKDDFLEAPTPKWLQKKEPEKNLKEPEKGKSKGKNKDIDMDR